LGSSRVLQGFAVRGVARRAFISVYVAVLGLAQCSAALPLAVGQTTCTAGLSCLRFLLYYLHCIHFLIFEVHFLFFESAGSGIEMP